SEVGSSADADRVAVEVEVVDWDLREVAGANVTLLVPKHRQAEIVDLPAPSPNAWRTDARGRCTVSFPERAREAVLLFAEKGGVGTSGKKGALPDEETGRVRLVLFPPAHLSGRVFRGVGIPAAGVTVRFTFGNPLGFRSGQTGRTPGPLETDERGRFEADLDSGGRYLVWASDGEVESDRTFVYADAGSKQELALWLEGALTIEARLLDPSGATVQGGSVMTWEQDPPQPLTPGVGTPGAFLRVDRSEGGRFILPVPRPGTYSVVGFGERFASSLAAPVEVHEGEPHPHVALSLLPLASISGRLRRESGPPIGNVPIQAVSVLESEPYAGVSGQHGSEYLHPTVEVRVAEDGSFRIPRLHPLSTYTLFIPRGQRDSSRRAVARSVPAGTEDLEIVVPEEAALTVVLDCGAPWDPVAHVEPGADLWREWEEGHWVEEEHAERAREAGSTGQATKRFRFEGLFPGDRYLLSAWAPGMGSAVEGPWTAKPGEQEIVIPLRLPSTLQVEVKDLEERPVPSASVFCERITECERLNAPRWLLTPAGGVVRFEGLGPGPYRLAAVRGAARSGWTEVEVAGGETRTLELTLDG
ncbi:MAG: carboxypeptidase-like regulatory domain-containing protein, partial [Planctomycetota bacterium]